MKTSHGLATRFSYLTAVLLSFPFVTGADDRGCARGGDVPVGSNGDAGLCTPEICRDLPRQLDAKLCADGTSLERSICAIGPAGRCGWDFPACADPADGGPGQIDAQSPACPPDACHGLPVRDDAKVCTDGTTLARTVCAPASNGACDWDFPACGHADAGVCAESKCAGQSRDNDARICPDGTVVGRTYCAPNDAGHCFWDFPPCAK
jgi:hypothetical protein